VPPEPIIPVLLPPVPELSLLELHPAAGASRVVAPNMAVHTAALAIEARLSMEVCLSVLTFSCAARRTRGVRVDERGRRAAGYSASSKTIGISLRASPDAGSIVVDRHGCVRTNEDEVTRANVASRMRGGLTCPAETGSN